MQETHGMADFVARQCSSPVVRLRIGPTCVEPKVEALARRATQGDALGVADHAPARSVPSKPAVGRVVSVEVNHIGVSVSAALLGRDGDVSRGHMTIERVRDGVVHASCQRRSEVRHRRVVLHVVRIAARSASGPREV